MQSDTHAGPSEASSLPPSSPTLFHHHHHPQPTATPPAEGASSLRRRRTTTISAADETLQISIATPFTESRRKECKPLPRNTTVLALKDIIAGGWGEDEEQWVRDGMRLVWQGRIVRDEEKLGDVVGIVGD
jgi:hypothetical protein